MKKSLLITLLMAGMLLPSVTRSQVDGRYTVNLNSGSFVPAENTARTEAAHSGLLTRSQHGGRHYLTLQFYSLPDEAMKNRLKSAGVQLLEYIPALSYTAVLHTNTDIASLRQFNVRSAFQFTAAQKTIPAILSGQVPDYAVNATGYADVKVLTYEKLPVARVAAAFSAAGATILEEQPAFRTWVLRVAKAQLVQLTELPFVQWVEYIDPPNQQENLPGRSIHRVNMLQDGVRNLKGDGMNMGVWDGGQVSRHLDFSPASRLTIVETGADDSHGTHVAGTMGGKGLINPQAKGMAPNARIFSYNYNGDVQVEMSTAIPNNTLISSNHSYHDGLGVQCGITGANSSYSLRARNTDVNLNNFPYHLHCHSAGNAQTSCTNGWTTITGAGKAAKNNLVVANVTTAEALSGSSSCGPVHDGRIKPEISGMGTSVFSTYTPLNSYGTISGTSMSTPGITGVAALVAQRYRQLNNNALPASSLIKNVMCNTARDLGNPGPDYRFGFGRVNALAAVRLLEGNRYIINSVATGGINNTVVNVPAGAARLRVMLTWNDPAAAANAATALVNNLNLSVINGATTTLPWILDPNNPANNATRAVDNISNIEQVTIDNPAAGDYTLRVQGASVPTGPAQEYYLTWFVEMNGIEVTYPIGGENLNPGSSETITWDNAGVTGSQTVEYSLNNGATWTVISAAVPAATTRLVWTIPAGANTSTALVRVSSGSLSDVSDAGFSILSTPTGLTGTAGSCAGQVNLSWTAVSTATAYDLYRLDATTGEYVLLAGNVTASPYTASGLTPGASTWFTIRAKNSTTGAVSERAVAINATVSSTACGTCGTPTGLSSGSITTSSATVSWAAVSGANNYTVEYKTTAATTWTTAASAATTTSVSITGLAAGTAYDWRVRANCTSGSSAFAQAQFTTTAVAGCVAPTGLTAGSITTTSATVSWTAVSGVSAYLVDYKAASSTTWIRAATATTSTSLSLSGLTAGTLYDWRVQSICASTSSPFAQAQFTTTASTTCPGPLDVSTNGTAAGAATIPFNTDVRGLISPTGDNDYYRFVITTGGTATITLTTLPADYDIRLYSSDGTTQLAISQAAGTTSETISRTYTPGTYFVRVYGYNGANNATTCYTLRVQLGTAAREAEPVSSGVQKQSAALFPNPAKNQVNVWVSGYTGRSSVQVFDLFGKQVMQQVVTDGQNTLDISSLPQGVYMMRVNNNGAAVKMMKFVKE